MFLFDVSKLEEMKKSYEKEMQKPDFWNDVERGQNISQSLKIVNDKINQIFQVQNKVEEVEVMIQLIEEENDESYVAELNSLIKSTEKELEAFKLKTLLNGKYDKNNAILSIHAGAGGTEAQD